MLGPAVLRYRSSTLDLRLDRERVGACRSRWSLAPLRGIGCSLPPLGRTVPVLPRCPHAGISLFRRVTYRVFRVTQCVRPCLVDKQGVSQVGQVCLKIGGRYASHAGLDSFRIALWRMGFSFGTGHASRRYHRRFYNEDATLLHVQLQRS